MLQQSTALTGTITALISLLSLDTTQPITLGLSKGLTSSDTFAVHGTLDSTTTTTTNAPQIGTISGTTPAQVLAGIAKQAALWPYVFLFRTGGTTAGSFFVTGEQTTAATVASTAAPAAGAYSAVITLTAYGSAGVRIGGDNAMLAGDKFDVYVTQDSTATTSTGCTKLGTITGGGGVGLTSLVAQGYPYAILYAQSRATAGGNILAAGVKAPPAGSSGDWSNGGNAFGVAGVLGTTDAQTMSIIGSNTTFLTDNGTTTTLGRTAGAAATVCQSGTGGFSATTTGAGAASLDSGTTGAVSVGTGVAGAGKIVSLGNTNGTTTTNVQGGSGGIVATCTGNASITAGSGGNGGVSVTATGTGSVTITPGATGEVVLPPRAAGAGNTTRIAFRELAAGGVNEVTLQAPDTLAADNNYTLPTAYPTINGQRLGSTTAGVMSWVGGPVNVQANNSSGQSIADGGAAAIVTNWTEITDSAAAFVPATGIFTAPVTGFYQVCAELEFTAIAAVAGAEFSVQLYVNGSLFAQAVEICQVAAANVKRQPKLAIGVQVTAGQTLDIRASQTSGSGANTLTFTTSRNLLSISLVS